ncbi:MAG TPA: hypothetical protein VF306_23780 [Pirellulales bacterium]
MNVAIFTESPIDDGVLRVFVDGLFGVPTEVTQLPLASRGWPATLRALPTVLKAAHFNSVAEALVVCADSNSHEVHTSTHKNQALTQCRHCVLEATVAETLRILKPTQPWHPLNVAIAVPCPSIEAWLLCGRDANCTEAAWIQRRTKIGAPGEVRRLKKILFGFDPPYPGRVVQQIAERRAAELLQDLPKLEQAFPSSFGLLAAAVRSWRPS